MDKMTRFTLKPQGDNPKILEAILLFVITIAIGKGYPKENVIKALDNCDIDIDFN